MLTNPPILKGTSEEQLQQIYTYLFQLAEQITYEINRLEGEISNGKKEG